jgi:hypothetical protein
MLRRLLLLLLLPLSLTAMERVGGWCQQGGNNVHTSGLASSDFWQQTFPSLTVTVYNAGTLTPATIFSNNTGTSKSNPFTAGSDGSWFFYAANGRYDVTCTGAASLSFPDNLLLDLGATTPITSINSQTGPAIAIQPGTSGTSFGVTNPSSNVIQINCPAASSGVSGCLQSSDWTAFNGKQAPLSTPTPPLVLTGTVLSITTPISVGNGGTGGSTATVGFNNLSPLTTKGDLIGFNGSSNVRVPVGTNGYILQAQSSAGVGWQWFNCALCAISSPIPVASGGTALASGTPGGVLCATASTTFAFSSALTSGAPVIGGGASACPGTTGPFTAYNSLSLSGQGMPAILFAPALSSTQSGTVGPSNAVASTNAGVYEVCFEAIITQVASVSSSLTPKISWNDGTARDTTHLVNNGTFAAYTSNTLNDVLSGCVTMATAAAQAITYTFTYASSGSPVMNYVYAVTAKEIR